MAAPAPRFADYDDLLAAPDHLVAELVAGELYTSPRPAPKHSVASTSLSEALGPPFRRGQGGPGGWLILFEPELHLGPNVLVPDLAGWRTERMPAVPDTPAIDLAPDWLAEVLSPSTRRLDRMVKLPVYAQAGVRHLWLVDPEAQTVEVYRLQEDGYLLLGVHGEREVAAMEPFEAVPIELCWLWGERPDDEPAKEP